MPATVCAGLRAFARPVHLHQRASGSRKLQRSRLQRGSGTQERDLKRLFWLCSGEWAAVPTYVHERIHRLRIDDVPSRRSHGWNVRADAAVQKS
jgi:hypothetical protein